MSKPTQHFRITRHIILFIALWTLVIAGLAAVHGYNLQKMTREIGIREARASFNNAMMTVQGNLDLLSLTLPENTEEHQMATDATQAARGAAQVGSQMLRYVNQQALNLKEISFPDLVKESITVSKTHTHPSITFKLTPPEHPIHCSLDPQQIKDVIESILTNAAESLDDNSGTIEITFGTAFFTTHSFPIVFQDPNLKDGDFIFCQIKDTGHGIESENCQRIFDPFYTTRFVGRGLGLALTVEIMRAHHGAILVESTPDKGTTVKIVLPNPVKSQHTSTSSAKKTTKALQLSGNILLADDEQMVLAIGRRMLASLGFTVHTAANGQEAVNLVREKKIHFCAAILDVSMPEMDGIEAMQAIRKINPTLTIVLSSGYSANSFFSEKEHGIKPDAFLEKPFHPSDLQHCLESLLS